MGKQDNTPLFKALCLLHGVENDVANRAIAGIHVCHLCPEQHCRNPLHAYIGTHSENCLDVPVEIRAEIARKRVATARLRGGRLVKRNRGGPTRKKKKSVRTETLRFALSSLGVSNTEIEKVLQVSPLPGLIDALRCLG